MKTISFNKIVGFNSVQKYTFSLKYYNHFGKQNKKEKHTFSHPSLPFDLRALHEIWFLWFLPKIRRNHVRKDNADAFTEV